MSPVQRQKKDERKNDGKREKYGWNPMMDWLSHDCLNSMVELVRAAGKNESVYLTHVDHEALVVQATDPRASVINDHFFVSLTAIALCFFRISNLPHDLPSNLVSQSQT